jgi:hypothetical protein
MRIPERGLRIQAVALHFASLRFFNQAAALSFVVMRRADGGAVGSLSRLRVPHLFCDVCCVSGCVRTFGSNGFALKGCSC